LESLIVVVISTEDKPQEVDDLIYAGEYMDIARTLKSDYAKRLKARRLICRVCKLKFRTRQDTQEHIRREHRRG
jgi:hypothetical protein